MLQLRQVEQDILAAGKVDSYMLEVLRQRLYVTGKIGRREADFLAELHKRVERHTPAFDDFFYRAIGDHILAGGRIGSDETAWLRRLVFAGGKLKDEARKLLHELKGEAREVSPEFEALYEETMQQPPEQRTSG